MGLVLATIKPWREIEKLRESRELRRFLREEEELDKGEREPEAEPVAKEDFQYLYYTNPNTWGPALESDLKNRIEAVRLRSSS